MKQININELNNIELMREIYKEIMETKEAINKTNAEKIDKLNGKVNILQERSEKIDELSDKINTMQEKVEKIDELSDKINTMQEKVEKIDELNDKINTMQEKVEKIDELSDSVKEIKKDIKSIKITLDKHTEKLEEHDKRFEFLEEKTDSIDKKLDNLDKIERLHFEYTRNKFGRLEKKIETSFTALNNKIDNEIDERKIDISQMEGIKEFDRIVLNDLGSRISILEEENEKYNLN